MNILSKIWGFISGLIGKREPYSQISDSKNQQKTENGSNFAGISASTKNGPLTIGDGNKTMTNGSFDSSNNIIINIENLTVTMPGNMDSVKSNIEKGIDDVIKNEYPNAGSSASDFKYLIRESSTPDELNGALKQIVESTAAVIGGKDLKQIAKSYLKGTLQNQNIKCPRCGNIIPSSSINCPSCGEPINWYYS